MEKNNLPVADTGIDLSLQLNGAAMDGDLDKVKAIVEVADRMELRRLSDEMDHDESY